MKRLLPWLLLPCLALAQADDTELKPQKSLLNQVSEEAAQTTLENIEIAASVTGTIDGKATSAQANDVDLDQLSQLVAVRLSELLGTKTKADAKGLPISL